MIFDWDKEKATANVKTHGISFEEASEVFDDPLHISVLDKRFNYFEERWISIGMTSKTRLVVLGHLYCIEEGGKESIRIITAREATRKERESYESIG